MQARSTPDPGVASSGGGGKGPAQDKIASQLNRDKKASRDVKGGGTAPGEAVSGQGLDSDLLGSGVSEKEEDKKGEHGRKNTSGQSGNPSATKGRGQDRKAEKDLRAAKMAGKGKKAQKKNKTSKESAKIDGFKLKTARWFYQSWMAAGTFVGAVWTWIYANLHALMLILLGPDKVCRFGEEWVLGSPAGAAAAAKKPGSKLMAQLEDKVKKIGFLEKLLLALLDLVFLISLIIYIMTLLMILFLLFRGWVIPIWIFQGWLKEYLGI